MVKLSKIYYVHNHMQMVSKSLKLMKILLIQELLIDHVIEGVVALLSVFLLLSQCSKNNV